MNWASMMVGLRLSWHVRLAVHRSKAANACAVLTSASRLTLEAMNASTIRPR
jgi:hypothetical protein